MDWGIVIMGAVIGAIVGVVYLIIDNKKKKDENK